MRIPLSIILDHLAQWSPCVLPLPDSRRAPAYKGVQLCYEEQTEFSADILYVLPRGCGMPPHAEGITFVCTELDAPAAEGATVLTVDFPGSPEKICATLSGHLYQYMEWENLTDQAIINECTEQHLLDLSEPFLCNPMVVLGPSFSCIAVSSSVTQEDALYYDLKVHGKPSNELMKVLIKHNEKKHDSVHGQFGPEIKYRLAKGPMGAEEIYVDVVAGDQLDFSMNLRFNKTPPTPGRIAFIGMLAQKLRALHIRNAEQQGRTTGLSPNEYVFSQVLNGNREVLSLLQDSDLLKNDYIVVTAEARSFRMLSRKAVVSIPGAHHFGFNERLFLFVPVNLFEPGSKYNIAQQHMYLEELGREFSQRLATSGVFCDLAQLKSACQQAERCYMLSCHVPPQNDDDPEPFLVEYRQFALTDMVLDFSSTHPLSSFSSRSYLAMRQCDLQTGSNYCQFTRDFILNGCNVAKTAQTWFLHKNSVIYRVEKIKTQFSIDLTSVPEQLLFLLSYSADEYTDLSGIRQMT